MREAVAAALIAGAGAAAAVLAAQHSAKIRSAVSALSDAAKDMGGATTDAVGSLLPSKDNGHDMQEEGMPD